MVNKKMANDEFEGEESVMAEMRTTMDDLCRQNQTLEDKVFHIKQRQWEDNPIEKVEILNSNLT